MLLAEGGDHALRIVLVGDFGHEPFRRQHDAGAGRSGAPGECGKVWPLCHGRRDNECFGLPALLHPLFNQTRALGQEQARLATALLSFQAFQ